MKIGDKVKVVKYGSLIWQNSKMEEPLSFPIVCQDGDIVWYDISPYLVGKVGVIRAVDSSGHYALDGIPEKTAWYTKEQLELVTNEVSDEHFDLCIDTFLSGDFAHCEELFNTLAYSGRKDLIRYIDKVELPAVKEFYFNLL